MLVKMAEGFDLAPDAKAVFQEEYSKIKLGLAAIYAVIQFGAQAATSVHGKPPSAIAWKPAAPHWTEVLQLFDLAEKSPAFGILLKSPPLILRHLNKAGFGKTGIIQRNQIFAPLPKKLLQAEREFRGDIEANQNLIPNYGDRYRQGEKISTAFAESTVNQGVSKRMVKKQQMRWSESGAHNLLQCGRRYSMTNSLRHSYVGIRACKLNSRPKLRRRPRSPHFEMLSQKTTEIR
jgi:hypothetical protein